jgi:hypothetical protein
LDSTYKMVTTSIDFDRLNIEFEGCDRDKNQKWFHQIYSARSNEGAAARTYQGSEK